MQDVIGIGSTFVDHFFEVDKQFLDKYNLKPEDDFLFKEKRVSPKDIFDKLPILSKSPGGNSLNTIAVLKSLGVNAGYYGILGKDKDSDYWIKSLGKIDLSHIVRKGKISRSACLLTNKRRSRTFLSEINYYDNDFFRRIDYNYLNDTRFVHIGPFLFSRRNSIKKLNRVFQKINKPLISFSPGILYFELGLKTIIPLLKRTYILFLNESELKMVLGKPVKKGGKDLLKYGPKVIVCTMGEHGSIITTKDEQIFSPSKKVKNIIDTTGAGDTFAAGILYGLLRKESLRWSSNYASKLAAKSLSDFGLNWLKKV